MAGRVLNLQSLETLLPKIPNVYELPGNELDVSIVVLGAEFGVRGVIKKLYSAFFRKLLDSPEKESKVTGTFPNSV